MGTGFIISKIYSYMPYIYMYVKRLGKMMRREASLNYYQCGAGCIKLDDGNFRALKLAWSGSLGHS